MPVRRRILHNKVWHPFFLMAKELEYATSLIVGPVERQLVHRRTALQTEASGANSSLQSSVRIFRLIVGPVSRQFVSRNLNVCFAKCARLSAGLPAKKEALTCCWHTLQPLCGFAQSVAIVR